MCESPVLVLGLHRVDLGLVPRVAQGALHGEVVPTHRVAGSERRHELVNRERHEPDERVATIAYASGPNSEADRRARDCRS